MSAALALAGAGLLGVAVPAARAPFGAGGAWVATAYAVPLGLVALITGRLAGRLGADRLLRLGLLALAGTSLLCSLAPNLPALVAVRALQGAAAGVLPATALALLLRVAPRDRLGEALGAFAAGALLLPAAAPLLGGVLVSHVGWRPLLAAEVPLALVAARAAMSLLPRSVTEPGAPLDVQGLAAGAAAMLCGLLALGGGPAWGWTSPVTVLLALAAAAALAVLIVVELSAADPLLDVRALADPASAAATLLLVVLAAVMAAGFLEAPSLLVRAQGAGPQGPWAPLLGGLAAAVALPPCGRLCDRTGPRWPAAAGLTLVADATWLLHLCGPATSVALVAALVLLRAAGLALALSAALGALLGAVEPGAENRAATTVTAALRLPVGLGLAVLAGVTAVPHAAAATPLIAPLQPAVGWAAIRALLLVTAGVSALGAVLALCLPSTTTGPGRIDLTRLLAALTGARQREITLTGTPARPPAAAATPEPAAPRRPRRPATPRTTTPRPRAPRPRTAATTPKTATAKRTTTTPRRPSSSRAKTPAAPKPRAPRTPRPSTTPEP
jgi:MFS family permease